MASDDARCDLDRDLILPVLRMKVRRCVVTVIHTDDDSDKIWILFMNARYFP